MDEINSVELNEDDILSMYSDLIENGQDTFIAKGCSSGTSMSYRCGCCVSSTTIYNSNCACTNYP